MPSTRQPWARSSCTVIRPISPRPVTTTASPSVGCDQADALQRDGAEHGEGGRLVVHAVGDAARRGCCGTHTISACLPLETTRSPTAKPSTPAPDLEHDADVAVAQRQRLVELAAHRLERGHQAVGAHLVEHLPDLVGLLARLVEQVGLAEVDQHALLSGGPLGAGAL